MTSLLIEIRDEVFTRISLKKTSLGFVFNDFDLEKTWLPRETLETMRADHPNGKVYVIGLAGLDQTNRSRRGSHVSLVEFPIQVGYQKADVDFDDISAIDTLVEFEEQLRDVCRLDVDPDKFSWVRNEPLKDENGTAQSYFMMRETGTFEVFFSAVYNTVLHNP